MPKPHTDQMMSDYAIYQLWSAIDDLKATREQHNAWRAGEVAKAVAELSAFSSPQLIAAE